jgi:hypothetical protein
LNAYTVESETEHCPFCGKPIVYGHTELMGVYYSQPLECPCVTEKKTMERAARIAEGREIVRNNMREYSGLSKRAVRQRFRNFKPDDGQKEAFEAARRFAKEYIEGKNTGTGLLFIGGVGSGKSHIAAAAVNAIIDYIPIPDDVADGADSRTAIYTGVRFVGTVKLLEQLRASYNDSESAQDIIRRYQESKLLVLDDLGAEKPSDWARERLFDIIDSRYNQCLPIIITTNEDVQGLRQKLGDRICDRIRSMCATHTVITRSHRNTADNRQPEVESGTDFEEPPVIPPREKTIYDRMRE